MVGGGIGVTPYASILNDLVFGTSTNRYSGVACKKVYFLWICPSHRYFEWFIDVLRDVERKDVTNVLEMHIFITQFFHKFDLRTTMLYICENHFQRLCRRFVTRQELLASSLSFTLFSSQVDVHRTEGDQSLRTAGYAVLPEVRAEEAQLRQQGRGVLLRARGHDQQRHRGGGGRQQVN